MRFCSLIIYQQNVCLPHQMKNYPPKNQIKLTNHCRDVVFPIQRNCQFHAKSPSCQNCTSKAQLACLKVCSLGACTFPRSKIERFFCISFVDRFSKEKFSFFAPQWQTGSIHQSRGSHFPLAPDPTRHWCSSETSVLKNLWQNGRRNHQHWIKAIGKYYKHIGRKPVIQIIMSAL